jgi:hypothetical protein
MTAPKGTIPKGAALSAERNLWFEAKALAELERLPTDAWEKMVALWNWLPLTHPATRRRILARCIVLAAKRGNPLSVKIAGLADRELSKAARASVHADDGLRKAARHLARNPRASLSKLAAVAGFDGKRTTVLAWKKRADFQTHLNDERVLAERERVQLAGLARERREHIQRRWDARRDARAARRSKKRSPKKRLLNG